MSDEKISDDAQWLRTLANNSGLVFVAHKQRVLDIAARLEALEEENKRLREACRGALNAIPETIGYSEPPTPPLIKVARILGAALSAESTK